MDNPNDLASNMIDRWYEFGAAIYQSLRLM